LILILFNNSISTAEFTYLQMRWEDNHEQSADQNLEGGSCGLFESTIPEFTWRNWENPQKRGWGSLVTRLRFKPNTSPAQV